MKRNGFINFFLLCFAIIFSSCQKNSPDDNRNEVTLYNCGSTEGNRDNSFICFDSLITDSRCPLIAQCPWSGTAIVQVSFHENANVHTFRMSLKGYPGVGYSSDTVVNNYRVIFLKLEPYPESYHPTPLPSEIKATFEISR